MVEILNQMILIVPKMVTKNQMILMVIQIQIQIQIQKKDKKMKLGQNMKKD